MKGREYLKEIEDNLCKKDAEFNRSKDEFFNFSVGIKSTEIHERIYEYAFNRGWELAQKKTGV
jgi:hypothetical protein